MFIFGLYPFEVRLSNCILYALKILLLSRPMTGVASIAFVLQLYKMKKHTLPSSDMNGNDPVKLLYTTPSLLSANAPKQNTFTMDSVLLSSMTFRPRRGG